MRAGALSLLRLVGALHCLGSDRSRAAARRAERSASIRPPNPRSGPVPARRTREPWPDSAAICVLAPRAGAAPGLSSRPVGRRHRPRNRPAGEGAETASAQIGLPRTLRRSGARPRGARGLGPSDRLRALARAAAARRRRSGTTLYLAGPARDPRLGRAPLQRPDRRRASRAARRRSSQRRASSMPLAADPGELEAEALDPAALRALRDRRATASPTPRRSPSPRSPARPTTRCSSTAPRASARPTCWARSPTTCAASTPGSRVGYTTAERFTNEFVTALRSGTADSASRTRYRDVDALLIDDVQFLEGKAQTEEEFFHTFNALYERGQPDRALERPPAARARAPRRAPARPLRVGAVRPGRRRPTSRPGSPSCAGSRRRGAALSSRRRRRVLREIAARCSNLRQLEGALTRVVAFASMIGHRAEPRPRPRPDRLAATSRRSDPAPDRATPSRRSRTRSATSSGISRPSCSPSRAPRSSSGRDSSRCTSPASSLSLSLQRDRRRLSARPRPRSCTPSRRREDRSARQRRPHRARARAGQAAHPIRNRPVRPRPAGTASPTGRGAIPPDPNSDHVPHTRRLTVISTTPQPPINIRGINSISADGQLKLSVTREDLVSRAQPRRPRARDRAARCRRSAGSC